MLVPADQSMVPRQRAATHGEPIIPATYLGGGTPGVGARVSTPSSVNTVPGAFRPVGVAITPGRVSDVRFISVTLTASGWSAWPHPASKSSAPAQVHRTIHTLPLTDINRQA
jgi:hypothetical protein